MYRLGDAQAIVLQTAEHLAHTLQALEKEVRARAPEQARAA